MRLMQIHKILEIDIFHCNLGSHSMQVSIVKTAAKYIHRSPGLYYCHDVFIEVCT